jgi:hypothetical protein
MIVSLAGSDLEGYAAAVARRIDPATAIGVVSASGDGELFRLLQAGLRPHGCALYALSADLLEEAAGDSQDRAEGALSRRLGCLVFSPEVDAYRACHGFARLDPSLSVVHARASAPFVGLVSIHKAGTNLAAELMRQLGYRVVGKGVDSAGCQPSPALGWREKEAFWVERPEPFTCYVSHFLPLHVGDDLEARPLLKAWVRDPFPLIFNHRDPRAALASLVRYLCGQTKSGEFTQATFLRSLALALDGLGPTARLGFCIEALGQYLDRGYRDHVWLLRSPRVHKLRFEDLVGPQGGGDERTQLASVASTMLLVGARGEQQAVAAKVFSPDARTFSQGQRDGWKSDFTAEHWARFSELHGDILESYGYLP